MVGQMREDDNFSSALSLKSSHENIFEEIERSRSDLFWQGDIILNEDVPNEIVVFFNVEMLGYYAHGLYEIRRIY
jgi:hypothetical protein